MASCVRQASNLLLTLTRASFFPQVPLTRYDCTVIIALFDIFQTLGLHGPMGVRVRRERPGPVRQLRPRLRQLRGLVQDARPHPNVHGRLRPHRAHRGRLLRHRTGEQNKLFVALYNTADWGEGLGGKDFGCEGGGPGDQIFLGTQKCQDPEIDIFSVLLIVFKLLIK